MLLTVVNNLTVEAVVVVMVMGIDCRGFVCALAKDI
tara:strand:+ start:382 stop:489 length:108 start_codon:yes stop_codon:yes gene_type:complete